LYKGHYLPSVLDLVLIHNATFMKNHDCITLIANSPTKVIFGSNPIMITDVNPIIRITTIPTLGSFGNAISSNDKMPLQFLELMITIQTYKGLCISLSKECMLFSFNYGDKILKSNWGK
jgi:hypothetical protein